MSSIVTEKSGRRRIDVILHDGRRVKIRLGKIARRKAESFKSYLEAIIRDRSIGHSHDAELLNWIESLEMKMKERLTLLGLLDSSERRNYTVKQLTDRCMETISIKPRTKINYEAAIKDLTEFFGASKLIRQIDTLEADKFHGWIFGRTLAKATVGRRFRTIRQMFGKALRWKLIQSNPFEGMKSAKETNADRMFFIDRPTIQKVIDVATDDEFRLVILLARYGGLRCPSEIVRLRWQDVKWDLGRIRVRSKKTEHNETSGERWMPLFPELRPALLQAFEEAPEGAEYVIRSYRDAEANLRTRLMRTIDRAGIKVWPKLWQNLRSSRQTELCEIFPLHVVCAWLGNSVQVAQSHYLQVKDAHFEKAVQIPAQQALATSREHPLPSTTDGRIAHGRSQPIVESMVAKTTQYPQGGESQSGKTRDQTANNEECGADHGAFYRRLLELLPSPTPEQQRKILRIAEGGAP